MASSHVKSKISLPGSRQRRLADWLYGSWPLIPTEEDRVKYEGSIRVVCIADTHNQEPELPYGDILIHAGDLTEHGSFDELQRQLDWLASQPHPHKIVIAGNHDVLLDESFLKAHPERKYGDHRTKFDLDWHDLVYLEDSSTLLEVRVPCSPNGLAIQMKKLKIYGSPYTPRYGVSAFQRPIKDDMWTGKVDRDVDIVVTHGPLHLHLDKQGFHNAGDPYLAHEVLRVQPRLAVCGHIHVAHGREDLVLSEALKLRDDVQRRWQGWRAIMKLATIVLWARLLVAIRGRHAVLEKQKVTTLVNAAYGKCESKGIVVFI